MSGSGHEASSWSGGPSPQADHDAVDFVGLAVMKADLFGAPGPSAQHP